MCGRVTVHMADGSTHQRTVRGQRGSMHQPLTHTELRRKLRGLSGHCIDLERPDAVLSGLPDAGDLTPLWEVLDTAG